MDPNKCLFDLVQAIYEGDRDTAVELADALKEWLSKGGFLPSNLIEDEPILDAWSKAICVGRS